MQVHGFGQGLVTFLGELNNMRTDYCSLHSRKILTIQQGKPCYLTSLFNPCTLQKKCQSCSRRLNPVNACQGFPMKLTLRG